MKFHDFDDLKDKYLGVPGTEKREQYEFDLKLDILGEMIKQTQREKPYAGRVGGHDWGKKIGNIETREKCA